MSHSIHTPNLRRLLAALVAAGLAWGLSACGGGDAAPVAESQPAATEVPVLDATALSVEARPTFHMAPVQLDEPADTDADGSGRSARMAPFGFTVPAALARVSTAGLTPDALATLTERARAQAANDPVAKPLAAVVYTPAQIRAAYGLPELTASPEQLGAGQTIYIVDAYDHPNALADLNAFNKRFGLPTCKSVAIPVTAALPLAAASPSECTFSKVYATAAGKLSAAAPAYNAGWAGEIALDVQWAHAIAPLARIVLIEATGAGISPLVGAINLANSMGPGVVSMSFGAGEGGWMGSVDAVFTASGMTYLASTGDNGMSVSWPSASANVLAIGGTTLSYDGSSARSETTWSGTGGGISAYVGLPAYQAGRGVPGLAALTMRGAADVSFNADPYSGQYVAFTAPGKTTPVWGAYGGTSISAPQWAGLLAVANAQRAAAGKAGLGAGHDALYNVAGGNANYASSFADVSTGNDGSCATCSAGSGFDLPTGLGTPNAGSLLAVLAGSDGATLDLPTVPGGSFTARVGTAFSGALGVTQSGTGRLAYFLSGAPAGMTVNAQGALVWPTPTVGTWNVAVTVRTVLGGTAQGTYVVTGRPANRAPVLSAKTFTTYTDVAFSASVDATDADGDALTYTLANAPAGLSLSDSGTLSWDQPVRGTYAVAVSAADPYGRKTTATITVKVLPPNVAPTVTSATLTGRAGVALSVKVPAADANGDKLTYSLSGAPTGLTVNALGMLTWAKPVRGSYSFSVTVRDVAGLSATGTLTLVIS